MTLQSIINALVNDAVETSLPLFRPELTLCVAIVVLLATRLIPGLNRIPAFPLALVGSLAALWAAIPQEGLAEWGAIERQELFTGMLVYDAVTAYVRLFLMAFGVLFVILARLTGIADRQDGQDFYCLVFGSLVGMCLMASANHLLMLFMGIEMASVPSYVLAGVVKGRRRSSEAALKYAVYGAGTAGIMLYGVSLLAGILGSAHLPTMARQLAEYDIAGKLASGDGYVQVLVLALGGMMLGVGLAFKLSAVPFHFWCPDVFEGASAEVDGFLSVASKAAALALLVRVGLGFGHIPGETNPTEANIPRTAATLAATDAGGRVPARFASDAAAAADEVPAVDAGPLSPARSFFVHLVGIASVVTCTFGNLAAYGQKNIKRMFAYSTIAHAGYMMMPAAAAVALVGRDQAAAGTAVSSLLLYAAFYLFMNLGAFAIVAFLRNSMQSEEIEDYAGLIGRSPLVAVCLTGILVSLVGIPPMAGFIGKFRIFQSLVEAGGPLMIFMLVAAGVNTAISLVYYLRVAKTVCIDSPPDSSRPVELGFFPVAYVLALSLPVLVLGILPNRVAEWAQQATAGLFG
ncbi:MAG: NADH-quinone oxidoreductase subunit N [Pirellulales bacterium]|nr:NADH-quinone oxidoreductase subunit N [Pirellulales bacterium]